VCFVIGEERPIDENKLQWKLVVSMCVCKFIVS
jgi:hypothetical protein